MSNKKFLFYGALILILVCASIYIFQGKSSKIIQLEEEVKTTVKIGTFLGNINPFPFFVTQTKGLLEEDKLEIELMPIESNVAVSALLSKDIDYLTFIRRGVAASLKEIPVKTIMCMVPYTDFGLFSKPNLELKDIKTIGISNWVTPPHYFALKVIEENNLSAEIIPAGSLGTQLQLLLQGKVDAVVASPAVLVELQIQEHGYETLKFFEEELPQGLVTTDEKIKNNSEEVEKVVKAFSLGVDFIKDNPEETKELLFTFLELEENEFNKNLIEKYYNSFREGYFSNDGIISKEGAEISIKLAKAGNYETLEDIESQIVTEEDMAACFDFSFIE